MREEASEDDGSRRGESEEGAGESGGGVRVEWTRSRDSVRRGGRGGACLEHCDEKKDG